MIFLPFLFFIIWLIFSYKKYGISVGTYILGVYAFSSFCTILIDSQNLYESDSVPNVDVGIIAPLIYILLLFLCLRPVVRLGKVDILPPSYKAERFLKFLSLAYFAMFIIVLIVAYERILFVLASESIANIRNEQYTGDAVSFYDYLTGFKRYVCALISVIAPSSFGMIMVFFYLVSFSKCSILYKLAAFFGSLTPLLISINIADRSSYFYWTIMLGFSLVLFYRYFPSKSKISVGILLFVVFGAILTYFLAVTNSRFGGRDTGSSGGLILYAGQPFLNFCRFFNVLDPPTTLNIIFPNITNYIFNGDNYFALAHKIEQQQHTPLCVFPTFIGIIYSVSGFIVTFFFLCFYLFVSNRHQRYLSSRAASIGQLFVLWSWAIIPAIGIITYFYLNGGGTAALMIWLLLSMVLNKKRKHESINDRTAPKGNRGELYNRRSECSL